MGFYKSLIESSAGRPYQDQWLSAGELLLPGGDLAGAILGCHTMGGWALLAPRGGARGVLQTLCLHRTAPNKESPQTPTVPRGEAAV